MRKKERKNHLTFALIIITTCLGLILPYSCQEKSDTLPQNDLQSEKNEFFVTENAVSKVVENFAMNLNASNKNSLKSKKTYSLNKFKDEKGEDLLYIVNYDEGGFLIIPADNRVYPILAHSETSSFTKNESDLKGGVTIWVKAMKEGIKKVKKENKKQSHEMKMAWDKYLKSSQLKVIDPDPCEDESYIIGPFLQTTWDQGVGYNNLCPTAAEMGGCSNPLEGGRALAGCVAVAMAQVMKYHQHPNSYSWSSMYNNLGTTATATLIRDIGDEDAVDMDYTCTQSTASTNNIVAALENIFNYSTSVTYGNYDHNIVKTELNNNRPVILSSTDTYEPTEGHAWVCDGYAHLYTCETGNTWLSFHMNWGWYHGECNGYFGWNSFDPTRTIYEEKSYLFSTDLKMVTGIKP